MFSKVAMLSTAMALSLLPGAGHAYDKSEVTLSTQSVAGTNGTSFVYFQAHESSSGRTTPVPTRRFVGCPVPYYVFWQNISYGPNYTSYDAKIYSCTTGRPIDNVLRAGQIRWTSGPMLITGVQNLDASGRLVYALDVGLDPAQIQPGQTTRLSAAIAGDFVAQADRTLNISVDPTGWAVTSWSIDFGDGRTASVPGGTTSIAVSHQYSAAGSVQPRVTAHVAGTAQVADFDPVTGGIVLLNEPFVVDVTNSTEGQVSQQPVVAYTAPASRAALVSQLASGAPPGTRRGFPAIEAPRGTVVYLYIRPVIDHEGEMTLDGRAAGSGSTSILAWTLRSGSRDGPAAQLTAPGASGGPGDAIAQQWNTPDQVGSSGPARYSIVVDYLVRTTYPDGQFRDFAFSGAVAVTVAYSANSG